MRIKLEYLLLLPLTAMIMSAAAGCATMDRSELFGRSPIALVSVVSNNEVNWKGEGPFSPVMITRATRRTMQDNPDLVYNTTADAFIDEIEESIRTTLEKSPHITFASKETVLHSRSYSEAKPFNYVKNEITMPSGYRYINSRDKNYLAASYRENGTSNHLFITLQLEKEMSSGFSKNGSFRIIVQMTVLLKDESGKTLFNKNYTVYSRDHANVSGGLYSEFEIRKMLLTSIQDACYYLIDDIAY